MEKDKSLREKLDILDNERKELNKKLRENTIKKDSLCNYIQRCASFDESVIFLIAKLMTEKEEEAYTPFVYKLYRTCIVYPRTLGEETYIGLGPERIVEDSIKNNRHDIDGLLFKGEVYQLCQKDYKIMEPNQYCQDSIVDYYRYEDLSEIRRGVTFGFLLNSFSIKNASQSTYLRYNFDKYPYVQDFISYLFELQNQRCGKYLSYEELCIAYDDFIKDKPMIRKKH